MKSEGENNLLSVLEGAECNMTDDIQALGYLQDEYFIWSNPKESFKYSYFEIQNAIMTLSKSMMYNRDCIRKSIEEIYKKGDDKSE